jgi:hypothetical protein
MLWTTVSFIEVANVALPGLEVQKILVNVQSDQPACTASSLQQLNIVTIDATELAFTVEPQLQVEPCRDSS